MKLLSPDNKVRGTPAGSGAGSRPGKAAVRPAKAGVAVSARAGLTVVTQIATARAGLPHARAFQKWAQAAHSTTAPARGSRHASLLTIRLVGSTESRRLNRTWRGKDKPTNVLSFPSGAPDLPAALQTPQLGDLAICAAVVAREAREQHKLLHAHWAHMVIHGVLHLLGHDHENDHDAHEMEAIEVQLLAGFGYSNPYA